MSQFFESGGQVLEFQLQHQSLQRMDLLAVQGTLKSLLQHHSSKVSILRCSALFTVQLSRPYMTTGKTIALTRRTFIDKYLCFLICYLGWLPGSSPSRIQGYPQDDSIGDKESKKGRKRGLIFLGLHRKPIKLLCSKESS